MGSHPMWRRRKVHEETVTRAQGLRRLKIEFGLCRPIKHYKNPLDLADKRTSTINRTRNNKQRTLLSICPRHPLLVVLKLSKNHRGVIVSPT